MTKLYVSEYAYMPQQTGVLYQLGAEPAVATQVVDYGAGHAESNAFNAKTKFVRLHTDAICSFKFSTAGTAAATTDARMAANQTEFFGVDQASGTALKVSAITNT